MGLKLARFLRQKGFSVFMTRAADKTVTIEERLRRINRKKNLVLFISIHANSSYNSQASGIETFCLKQSLFSRGPSSMDQCSVSFVQNKNSIMYKKSWELASRLQKNILLYAKREYPRIINRHVKHSVARMLLGVPLPGVLIEIGFLSNKIEARLLKKEYYRTLLAQGIFKGIVQFVHQ